MPKTESQPFYNVMPEAAGNPVPMRKVSAVKADAIFKSDKPAVVSTTGVTPDTTITLNGPTGAKRSFFSRKSVLIPLFIIILSIAGVATWLVSGALKKAPEEVVTPVQTEDQQPADPDVTTPGDWLARFFGSETCTNKPVCADASDPDRDGLTNKEENTEETDPNKPDSDNDGIADGDEFHIFKSEPLISRTYRNGKFNDADFVKGGFDIATNAKYTNEQLAAIKALVKEKGLHQPTLTTIGTVALSLYDFQDPNAPALDPSIDQSPQGKLDRDTNRQANIKKIGAALLKYQETKKAYPATSDFVAMVEAIKPFNTTVATNYVDPINVQQYVYGYTGSTSDFTLSYFSETQNQLIKYGAKDAIDTKNKENAAVNNDQRMADLENIASALKVYSSMQVSTQSDKLYVFPTKEQYPNVLVENHLITSVPKDPSGNAYDYQVTPNYESFTLKALYQNPPKGTTGYMCNELECKNF